MYKRQALATPVFLSLYAENDLRLDKYFAETDEKGFRKNKKAGSNNYLCTFRVGEIYLTAAEAAARLGELSQARTRLLELMRKRYAPEAYEAKSVVVNAMDKEALVQEILDERARELAFEGHRFFDVRRWMIAPQTESKTMHGIEITRATDGTKTWKEFDVRTHVWRPAMYFFPIPYNETVKSLSLIHI